MAYFTLSILSFFFCQLSSTVEGQQLNLNNNNAAQNISSKNANISQSTTSTSQKVDFTSNLTSITPKTNEGEKLKQEELLKLPKIKWYGTEINTTEIADCDWPMEFRRKYEYCFDKSFGNDYKTTPIGNRSDLMNFGYGILNVKIMDSMMNCGRDKDCDMTPEESADLEHQYKAWWADIAKLIEFRKCLKANVEASARSCNPDSEVSQVFKGMAGLYLNMIDIIMDTYATNDPKSSTVLSDSTKTCWSKTAEAVHMTTALYLKTQYYRKNSVLCWDTSKSAICEPDCFTFGSMLECVREACPKEKNFANLTIWSWYFNDRGGAKKVCSINESTSKCHIGVLSSDMKDHNTSTARHLYEVVKNNYDSVKTQIETKFHVPFYIFIVVVFSMLVLFILILTLVFTWYNGGFAGTAVVRYAKVIGSSGGENDSANEGRGASRANKFRVNVDETRSLTQNYEDAE